MESYLLEEDRVVDTFAARELQVPDGQKGIDSLGHYLLREGRGLELKNRQPDKKQKVVV